MNAVRLHVVVPEDRELRISLPASVPPGEAEVILLTDAPAQWTGSVDALLDAVDDWRATHPGRRTREEIDAYLDAERATWEGR